MIFSLFGGRQKQPADNGASDVARFYDATTDKFLAVYGEVIQAFRTKDVSAYLDYTMKSAQLGADMRMIDAGCGVCGPSSYFAQQIPGLFIEACTISPVQSEKANVNVQEKGVSEQVKVTIADYHQLSKTFGSNGFDRVLFLESFGHSKNKSLAIRSAWEVLQPGGKLYIKDLFRRESSDEWEQLHIDHICGQINNAYAYEIGDVNQVLSDIRKQGFILEFLRPPQVDMDQFEHLTISNDFQNLFDIGKIDSWDNYVFPIDFYEILAVKPAFDLQRNLHLYYMNK
jgi:cyclopropane fatty-acyl-phospholipid synthase-like methyltransferase